MPGTPDESISVAILAGGRSRRLGHDKALVKLTSEGPTLLDIAVQTATSLSSDTMIVGRKGTEPPHGVRWIADQHEGRGPLGGVATALSEAEFDRCLVLSCDMPFLSIGALRYLIRVPWDGDAVVPVTREASRQGSHETWQTLHAIYSRSALRLVDEQVRQGDLRTTSWLAQAQVRWVAEKEIRHFDPELLTFFSVNTPEDLMHARQIYQNLRNNAVADT